MAYDFKNLNEVPAQDKPTENTTVMAFEGGNPRQIPAGELGGGAVLITIPYDDPGWDSLSFNFNYDPIYEALMANKTVILRPSRDRFGGTTELRTLVASWVFDPNHGLTITIGGGNEWEFTNGSYHTTA